MKMDLTTVFKWISTPYHHLPFNEQYWKEVSSKVCEIEEPLQMTRNTAALRFTPGYGVMFKDAQDLYPEWVDTKNAEKRSIQHA